MIKKLIYIFVCAFAIQSYAQEGSASPYSFYGIGSTKFKGTVENQSMGGLAIYKDSIHLNLRNPANYGGKNLISYQNESRPVTFSVGGSHNTSKLKSNNASGKNATSTFDYLAIGIPLGKLGFGMGILPYSSVGYKLENTNEFGNKSHKYEGSGGVNKTYLSFGYQFDDHLSIGITGEYNFGIIENKTIQFGYDANQTPLITDIREVNKSKINGVNVNVGLHYKRIFNKKYEFQFASTFQPQSTLSSRNTRVISNITISPTTLNENTVTSITPDLAASGLATTSLTLPSKFTIGGGIGKPRRWFVGTDFTLQNSKGFQNKLYSYSNVTFENATSLSVGGFYIPKYNSYSKYLKRVVYRAGFHADKLGLKINGQSINEYGISLGAGLPVGNLFSNANFGIEFGQRGTTSSNLIKENFINFQVSLSLNDRWFKKRKYN